MDPNRRKLLLGALYGTGMMGLRALATGLPISLLTHPHVARADTPAPGCPAKPQYLYFLTSGSGDPLNANVPGCYEDPGIYHPADPTMAPTPMTLGGRTLNAALPWTQLPAAMQARACFFHHATYTNAHPDAAKVNRLMGAVQRQEMLVSLLAKSMAPCLSTVQSAPAVLSGNLITYAGSVLPVLSPANLQAVLATPTGALAKLQTIRDTHVDQLNALFKQSGTTAQRAALDQYALSQSQARSLSQQLLSDLSTIKGSSRTDLNTAAAVMFKMNVTSVVVGSYSFGGDNHGDAGLANETANTVASVQALGDFFAKVSAYQMQDQVTIALQNVFGRTLSTASHSGDADGRNHNPNHHCSVMIGSGFKGSVIGGVKLNASGKDYTSMGFDSATGAPNDAGDVPYEQTLGSVGKTLGAAVGVDRTVLDTQITAGKVVPAALA